MGAAPESRPPPPRDKERQLASRKCRRESTPQTRAKMERRLAQIEESVARYLSQLDSADRQEPSEARTTKTTRLKEKIAKLKEEVKRLHGLKTRMLATLDQQISLTDPDSSSMATSGWGSGVVGYNPSRGRY